MLKKIFDLIFGREIVEQESMIESRESEGFLNGINYAKSIIECENKEEQISLLECIMSTIKKDIQYSLLSELIYKPKEISIDIGRGRFIPIDIKDAEKKQVIHIKRSSKKVDILKDTLFLVPWKKVSRTNEVKFFCKNKNRFENLNHMGDYITELDVVYIHNGIHSIVTAIELNIEGKIEVNKIRELNKVFEHMHTDGVYWYNSHTNEVIQEVFDFRIGLLYEVAKMKYHLTKEE